MDRLKSLDWIDHAPLMTECGEAADIGGIFTRMCAALREAERFELSDDVARAAYNLTRSKPSTLLAALPMSRAPTASSGSSGAAGSPPTG